MAIGGGVTNQEFKSQKDFVKALSNQFHVSRSKTRIGIIHYGSDATVVQTLKDSRESYRFIPVVER